MSDDQPPPNVHVTIADHSTISNSAITVNAAGRDLNVYPPPPERPLRQLPAPLRDFLGRAQEREQLLLALGIPAGRTAAIATIQGMGGVGKTALAIAVANDLAAGYPDGQLVIAMQAGSGAPRSTAAGLREIVQLFHAPAQPLPEALDALTTLYRGYLGGKRILIVLDDVLNTAAARTFVPPAGCALLVTSRQAITLDGQDATVRLQPFTDEAHTLLIQLAPRLAHEPDLDQLLQRAGGLPLAVRVLGQTFAQRQTLTVERYLGWLADTTKRHQAFHHEDRNVAAILVVSDDLLTQEQPALAERWRMLHVCPAPFSVALVAALWGESDLDAVETQLEILESRSMLSYDPPTRRWSMHDLLRDVARDRSVPEHTQGAALRHAQFYRAVVKDIDHDYKAGGTDTLHALQHFDAERQHIDHAWTWLEQHPRSETDGLWLDYAFALRALRRLRYTDTPSYHETELTIARRHRNLFAESIALNELGDWAMYEGHMERAHARYEESIQVARRCRYHLGETISYNKIATFHMRQQHTKAAEHYLQLTIARCRHHPERPTYRRTHVAALINLASLCLREERWSDAEASAMEAVTMAASIGHLVGLQIALHNLAVATMELGNRVRATELATAAAAYAEQLGDDDAYARAHQFLGGIHEGDHGEYQE